jgi:hypothetical protein
MGVSVNALQYLEYYEQFYILLRALKYVSADCTQAHGSQSRRATGDTVHILCVSYFLWLHVDGHHPLLALYCPCK